jgi:N-glycosylase/DNA lyase
MLQQRKTIFEMFQVADCIMLMSLDQPAAIPVDTHMFQIAANQVKV